MAKRKVKELVDPWIYNGQPVSTIDLDNYYGFNTKNNGRRKKAG